MDPIEDLDPICRLIGQVAEKYGITEERAERVVLGLAPVPGSLADARERLGAAWREFLDALADSLPEVVRRHLPGRCPDCGERCEDHPSVRCNPAWYRSQ
jgi:hypothetical protein